MAVTYSGVDPTRVAGMIEQLVGYKKNIQSILNDISTAKIAEIRANYEGHAADAVMTRTQNLCKQCDSLVEEIVTKIVGDINRDLDDIAKTDSNLAGE